MSGEEPPNRPPSLTEEWAEERATESTRDRVYAAAIQLYEPARVATVADRADVSKETAREYLKWFAEIGVVTRESTSPAAFRRNESYFEWRRVQRLRELSAEELREALGRLVERETEYRDRYEADGPDDVDALENADYTDLEVVWRDLEEWRTVRRRIRELERARKERNDSAAASA